MSVGASQLETPVALRFPSTRYQGSKAKLVDWIWDNIKEMPFTTCLDAFGGSGVVAHRLKGEGKDVTYNDILEHNYHFGRALIENDDVSLGSDEVSVILSEHDGVVYPDFISRTFGDIYFTDMENRWLDRVVTNMKQLTDKYAWSLAFFALAQSCIVKRPYNLFHRKNLYIRQANVKRGFGNKTSWDRGFEEWFGRFVREANAAVGPGQTPCRACKGDVVDVDGEYDLVYIDTPYISKSGSAVDYADFYHFLEGICRYDDWGELIDWKSKHRRMVRQPSRWCDKGMVHRAFEELFARFADSIIVVSYRSDGIPTIDELESLLKRHKKTVSIKTFGRYKYALSRNGASAEVLLIGR